MKFYTIKNYADLVNLTDAAVRDQIKRHKITSLQVAQPLDKLVVTDEGSATTIISMMNLKGGCAKTTTAVHLAILLSRLEYKVLLIDTDHQNQCRLFFPPPEHETKFTLVDLLGGADIKKCIHDIKGSTLKIIYSSHRLALITPGYKDYKWMNILIGPIKRDYDFIIFDTSPNFDIINRSVAVAATHIVIPLVPSGMHIAGLNEFIEGLIQVTEIPKNKILGILLTIVEQRLQEHQALTNELREKYPDILFGANIPKDANLAKISSLQTNIFDFMEKSKSSQAIKKFTWELLQRL